ncbi:cell division protein DivIVA [Corynebacterium sp. S7]
MLSWILLIIVLLALIVVGTWAFGELFGRGELLPPMEESQDVIAANAEAIRSGRIDDIALEVVPRGYRQDQVDAIIAQLTQSDRVSLPNHPAQSAVTSTDEISSPSSNEKEVK